MRIKNDIKIGVGVGQFIFGMTQNDVLKLLGNPDVKVDSKYLYGQIRQTFKNKSLGIEFSFDSDNNYKLISINVEESKYLFDEESSIIEFSLNEILRIFERRHFSTPTIDFR